jgi:hypothetical protein
MAGGEAVLGADIVGIKPANKHSFIFSYGDYGFRRTETLASGKNR